MRLGLVLLAGCWTSSPVPAPVGETSSAFEITLERTACGEGACPVYMVSIDGEGRVHWNGVHYVHAHGERRATVPRARIPELRSKLDEIQFFERDPQGNLPRPRGCGVTPCTFDARLCPPSSAAIVTVRDTRRTHVVRNDHCGATPLDDLEALIDDIARTSAWIGERVTQ